MAISTDSGIRLPVFIHSLFRAGSTYIFNVFRRSDAGYWCYQESLHEIAFMAKDSPELLQVDHGDEKVKTLRHPNIDRPYFQELYEVWPDWQDEIKESSVYDAYFSENIQDNGIGFWRSLINRAKGRPVFQECRTSGRIKAIKTQLEGIHLYLWRNPWDQWWSYKINDYFDTANQLIVHAAKSPTPLKLMLHALRLPRYDRKDIAGAFGFYRERPLTTEESYLVFYMLWCMALREGLTYADLTISIDHLSDSVSYQSEVQNKLRELGIDGIELSDCRVPQGFYSEKDRAFFHAAESRVHLWLMEGGWTKSDIDVILDEREKLAPTLMSVPSSKIKSKNLVEQSERFSELARRFETANAEHQRLAITKRQQLEISLDETLIGLDKALTRESQTQNHLTVALTAVQQAQMQTQEAFGIARQAEAVTKQVQERAAQQEKELNRHLESVGLELQNVSEANHHHFQLLEQRCQELDAVYSSKSWRMTALFRWPVHQLRLIREFGLRNRLKALVRKILRRTNHYLHVRPVLRNRLLRLSQKIGIYNMLKRVRDRLREGQTGVGDMAARERSSQRSYAQLTPHAQRIYAALNKTVEEQKGQK
jgi:hypothetical protein